jgi:integrase/recombinase XerD
VSLIISRPTSLPDRYNFSMVRTAKVWRLCRMRHNEHRPAVSTQLRWYRDGVDVERHLPELSTYLGHAHITDTYWYLTATPELLGYALLQVERSEQEHHP